MPEMRGGVGSPRAPRFGAKEESDFGERRAAACGLTQAEVAGGKGIWAAQEPHGEILRGPFADAGQGFELRHGLFAGRAGRKRESACSGGAGDFADGLRAATRQAKRSDVGHLG